MMCLVQRGSHESFPSVPWSSMYTLTFSRSTGIDTFVRCNFQEANRAYESLNALERGVLILTRAILGNRRTLTAFICYAIALHVLVMFTTYECTVSSGTQLQKQPYGS